MVERNNHGSGVLALIESVCRYPRIYRQVGPDGLADDIGESSRGDRTTERGLIEQPDRFMSRRLLAECRSFVRQPDGSTGARAGTHDDRVMAMAIGLAARAELLEIVAISL